jgi:RimJ/RimL family protein N-acetyltransferase
MVGITEFQLSDFDCSVKNLAINDADTLQQLYEKCADYNYLMEGRPPSATAALEEFTAVPEGKIQDDKCMLGIFNSQNELIGLIEGMRNYPEDKVWWVGLIMLAPAHRCKGLLYPLLKEFEQYIANQGMDYVMASIIETNSKVLRLWKRMGFKIVRQVERKQPNTTSHLYFIVRRKVLYLSN